MDLNFFLQYYWFFYQNVEQLWDFGRWRSSASDKSKVKIRRKLREPRFCFQTRSDVDVLDDGYKWRKYGQKVVKNSLHPRYFFYPLIPISPCTG